MRDWENKLYKVGIDIVFAINREDIILDEQHSFKIVVLFNMCLIFTSQNSLAGK
jgi:hypothetical protein